MAHYVTKQAGNYGDANIFYTSDKQQLTVTANNVLSSAWQNANLTWASSHNSYGAIFLVYPNDLTGLIDRSLTVEFWSDSVLQETKTLTAAQIKSWSDGADDSAIYVVNFRWASAYAVTSGQSFYYKLYESGGTTGHWRTYGQSSLGPYFIEYTDTTASAPTSAVNVVVLAHNTVFAANATLPNEVDICTGVDVSVATGVALGLYGNTSTVFRHAANSTFKIGTDGSPVSGVVFDWSTSTSNICDTFSHWITSTYGTRTQLEIYGAYPATERAELDASIAVGVTSFTTHANVSAWTSGWKFFFSNRTGRTAVQEVYTLNGAPTSLGGGQYRVDFTPALATAGVHVGTYHKGMAHLIDGYGVQIKGKIAANAGATFVMGRPCKKIMRGISFYGCGTPVDRTVTGLLIDDPTAADPAKIGIYSTTHCSFYGSAGPFYRSEPAVPLGNTVENLQSCGCVPYEGYRYASYTAEGSLTVNNLWVNSAGRAASWVDSKVTLSNVYLTQAYSSGNYAGQKDKTNVSGTITNLRIKGSSGNTTRAFSYGALALIGSNCVMKDIYIDDCACALEVVEPTYAINFSIENLVIGQDVANDFGGNWRFGALWDLRVIGGLGALAFTAQSPFAQKDIMAGSVVLFTDFAGTADDYRSWTKTGQFVSSGSTKMTQKYIGTGLVNFWDYRIATEAISGTKIYAAIKCQIANAAFYGGTHTDPTFTITYDGTSTQTATASENTTEQTLNVIFTPTTDGTELKATISGATDQTTNGNVDWSAMAFNLRKAGKIYKSYAYIVTHLSKDIILNLAALDTNPFWATDDSTAATWLAKLSYDGTTLTVTDNLSIIEAYQAMQYWGRLDANMGLPLPLDTLDGTNLTLACDLVINTGKTLTGTGKHLTLATGKTLTLNGTGDADFPVTVDNGTHVKLRVTNGIAGDKLRIEKTSDASLIAEGTLSGTTFMASYLWVGDVNVTLIIRNASGTPKYLDYVASGTITNTGLAMIAAQQLDLIAV